MTNDSNTITGQLEFENRTFSYEVSNGISGKIFKGCLDLYIKDDKGNNAAVMLNPDESVEHKVKDVARLQKWL